MTLVRVSSTCSRRPAAKAFQEIIIGVNVGLRCRSLESIGRVTGDAEAKQPPHARSDAALWQSELDILIHCICCESLTVFVGSPGPIARVECASARLATIAMDDVTLDPPLYTMPHESKVYFNLASPAMSVIRVDLQVGQHDAHGHSIIVLGVMAFCGFECCSRPRMDFARDFT